MKTITSWGAIMKEEHRESLRALATFLSVAAAAALVLLTLVWILCRAAR